MQILDGKQIHETILEQLRPSISELKQKNISLKLSIISVGSHPGSKTYIQNKIKACDKVGIEHVHFAFPETVAQNEILETIKKLNDDVSVTGILCQFPFPSHLCEQEIIETINPKKDVDCFHPYNIGRLSSGNPISMPVTPFGIYQILNLSKIEVKGKHMVIIGRGNTVGKPLSILMSLKGMDATVTLCHSMTEKIKTISQQADILVAAFGQANIITSDYISKGCTIIDVGLNYIEDVSSKKLKLVGDVDFESVKNKAHAITPVPGGVGPVTVAMLIYNTINLAKIQSGDKPLTIF
jgi:methylenetetrahydrofolate dehydrogenase (NADP+)/methenyltetrahydrofolate cyclohydrolase